MTTSTLVGAPASVLDDLVGFFDEGVPEEGVGVGAVEDGDAGLG
jgi:hypothetical protein